MIRLNSFFELRDDADRQLFLHLAQLLTTASLSEPGCLGYDVMQSAFNQRMMMFCESWTDNDALVAHSSSAHFQSIVPQLKAMMKGGATRVNRFESNL